MCVGGHTFVVVCVSECVCIGAQVRMPSRENVSA